MRRAVGFAALAFGFAAGVAAQEPATAFRLGDHATLAFDAEARLRGDIADGNGSRRGDQAPELLLRGLLGADVRWDEWLRLCGQLGTGQGLSLHEPAPASVENDAAVQQLFAACTTHVGAMRLQAIVGRQEFAEGPRQLLSVGDGANLHRTWNGVRLLADTEGVRVGAYVLRATRLGAGWFDDGVDDAVRLHGLHADWSSAASADDAGVHVAPFWIHSELPLVRWRGRSGRDERDTLGGRVRGRVGTIAFDATLAHQSGTFADSRIDAFGLFTACEFACAAGPSWPRLTLRGDIASGGDGGADGATTVRGFHPLFASSTWLGEGQLLGGSNLALIAPGLVLRPVPGLELRCEYGLARRLVADAAAYGGRLRAYSGTESVPGHDLGGLLRIGANWRVDDTSMLELGFERLAAGDVLRRAGFGGGTYAFLSLRLRL